MKQIIVVASDKDEVENNFSEHGFHVSWCRFAIEEIIRIRDCSNVIFLRITDEDEDELKKIGLYLRDLCIEDEKILYLYGNRVGVDIVRARIPSLYVRKTTYAFASALNELLDDLSAFVNESESGRPSILIIDDDTAYIGSLRLHLDSKFQVYVSHNDVTEASSLILRSDLVLIGSGASYTIAEYFNIVRAINSRRHSSRFHLYCLASSDEEREQIRAGNENLIVLSKETDPARVAAFLSKKAAIEQKTSEG